MKKIFTLFFAVLFALTAFAQDCSDVFISEYVEGWSNNKAIEIYNPTSSNVDMSNYRLIRWSNGSDDADTDPRYVLDLSGTIAPYDVMVICQDTTFAGQDTMLAQQLKDAATWFGPADYNSGLAGSRVVFWNGDDALSIQKNVGGNWTDVDIFGEIGVRPLNWTGTTSPVGGWDDTPPHADGQGTYLTKDRILIRKRTVKQGVDITAMNAYGVNSWNGLAQFDTLVKEYTDSLLDLNFDSLGFHSCDCNTTSISDNEEKVFMNVYPNPVEGGQLNIQASEEIYRVSIANIIGQTMMDNSNIRGEKNIHLNVKDLDKGLYLVRVYLRNERTILHKIVIR